MRDPGEILFRLRQEWGSLRLWLFPPELRMFPSEPDPGFGFPPVEASLAEVRGTSAEAAIIEVADRVVTGVWPLFGQWIELGAEPAWRRDPISGAESALMYWRRVPYLDPVVAGDHKWVWEPNRHQPLTALAQAWRLTGREDYKQTLYRLLDHWITSNPFSVGMNWTSALEVAIRAISWLWIDYLAGAGMGDDLRRKFLTGLYQHGCYLAANLSVYFSPNTHLLGEAVALHALGVAYPAFPGADRWRQLGGRWVKTQYSAQVRSDGVHAERSSYYHVYALDMFLFHQRFAGADAAGRAVTERMAGYLAALLGKDGEIPLLGDDDGGRLFHPFGHRRRFGRATLAVFADMYPDHVLARPWLADGAAREDRSDLAAWWIGAPRISRKEHLDPSASRLFPESGVAILTADEVQIVMQAGPFGKWRGGHSHDDALSITLRARGRDILADSGTFTYVGNNALRDWFRLAGAHNTMAVAGPQRLRSESPFSWLERPETRILGWESNGTSDWLDAVCEISGHKYRRTILFEKHSRRLWIADQVEGPQARQLQQFWHAGETTHPTDGNCFRFGETLLVVERDAEVSIAETWQSEHFGHRRVTAGLIARKAHRIAALWQDRLEDTLPSLQVDWETGQVAMRIHPGDNAVKVKLGTQGS